MKKKSTTITPILLKSRCKGDSFNVVIRINHEGRFYYNLGFYAKESEWDEKLHRLKKKYPNSEILNKLISDKVYQFEQRYYMFQSTNTPFTAKMLCEEINTEAQSLRLDKLVERLSDERNLTNGTRDSYVYACKRLYKYMGKDVILLSELTTQLLRKFYDWLELNKKSMRTIKLTMGNLASIFNYAIQKHLISKDSYPFDGFKYRVKPNHVALSSLQITKILSYFINNYTLVDLTSNEISYKNYINHITLHHRELYISLFLIGYYMQGLALADLLAIRMEQISFITRGENEYMIIKEIKRQKTGIPVEIVVEMTDEFKVLIQVYLSTAKERDGWLFPVYSELKFERLTDKIVTDHRRYVTKAISHHMSDIAKELGFEDTKLTYYICRHSFATHYMQKTNGNILALASMLGHSPRITEMYIQELNNVDAIIEAKKGMF